MSRDMRVFRASADEWEIIKRNAKEVGMKPCTYVRRMAVHGEIKKYDMKIVNDFRLELIRIGTNINQIAKMVNSTNSVYAKDFENMKNEFSELEKIARKWLKPLDYKL
ncbi:MAG: MobC family plasmid mobilization relaxosome protein [Oscillospiraceae bacterium]|nr:MobC family plasmid mobilization relaxosome protein [Oscillospiraceae bacterium]